MKMVMHCIQCSQSIAVQDVGNFGYVRGKGFKTENIVDYTSAEEDGFLGRNWKLTPIERMKKAYCALSPRADEELFIEFCEDFDYAPVLFEAFHGKRRTKIDISH
jgi:hypothetical protein